MSRAFAPSSWSQAFHPILREPPMKVPLLAHIHAPKTAGSAFRRALDENYQQAHVHLYFDNSTTFVYENAELAELVRDPSIKAFSSHFVRRFPPVLAGRPVQYVTFLRNPIEQFISYITYTRKHYAAIKDLVLLDHLRPRCRAKHSRKRPMDSRRAGQLLSQFSRKLRHQFLRSLFAFRLAWPRLRG